MNIKKLNGDKMYSDILSAVLYNRGVKDVEKYIKLNSDCLNEYTSFDNIEKAKDCFVKHIENGSKISIVVDCDVDGYTSSAIIYKYISDNFKNPLEFIIHTGKQHGLSEDIKIPDNTNLLIIPDAGTNDAEQCKKLKSQGIDIIVLDHHEKEVENPYAIIVNSSFGKYPNKHLCGAGVVYKFLQYIDDEMWIDNAERYIDLVALGLISDCMDLRDCENRFLISQGLKNINNNLFKTLIKCQDYSIKGEITPLSIQFYITPLINALIRFGSQEEKELLFKGFVEDFCVFEYKNRKTGIIEDENIYNRVFRFCRNAHSRQKKAKEKTFEIIKNYIEKNNLDKEPIIMIDVTEICDNTMTGLVANQIADYFKTPCLMLREYETGKYSGSARNFKNSYIENFKDYICQTGNFEKAVGHQSAFGVFINQNEIKDFYSKLRNDFKDNKKIFHYIDFVYDEAEIDISLAKNFVDLNNWWGNEISEPTILINKITIPIEKIEFLGATKNTWCYSSDNGVKFIQFKCEEDNSILLLDSFLEKITINAIGKFNKNIYKGTVTMQFIIKDYEICND